MAMTIKKLIENHENDFRLEVIGGKEGVDNVVSWAYCVEVISNKNFLQGGELVITTGVGKADKNWLFLFVEALIQREVSGLILNLSEYNANISHEVIELCNVNNFPLITMPCNERNYNIIKEFCYEIMQDEKREIDIGQTLRSMIFYPREAKQHFHILQEYGFEINKNFLIIAFDIRFKGTEPENFIHTFRFASEKSLRSMKVRYGHFEYETVYEKMQIFILNGLEKELVRDTVSKFQKALNAYPNIEATIGVGAMTGNINNLSKNFKKAQYVTRLGRRKGSTPIFFDDAGIDKVLLSVDDSEVLKEYYLEILGDLIQHDSQNNTQYLELLKIYLENDASVQITADKLYVHRNTINYQLNRIKSITGVNLNELDERFRLMLAYRIGDFI